MRSDKRVTYSFRFIGVSQDEVNFIRNELQKEYKSLMPYDESESRKVLVYELLDNCDGHKIANCIESLRSEVVTDVFVSVRSYENSEIIDVPRYVTKFVNDSSTELTFSFTVS